MIEEYYARLAKLNKHPELLKDKPEEQKAKLKTALNKIQDKMDGSDEELKEAMTEFIQAFDELDLADTKGTKTRSLSFKKGTNLPRQLINDVTIMTLKNI